VEVSYYVVAYEVQIWCWVFFLYTVFASQNKFILRESLKNVCSQWSSAKQTITFISTITLMLLHQSFV